MEELQLNKPSSIPLDRNDQMNKVYKINHMKNTKTQ